LYTLLKLSSRIPATVGINLDTTVPMTDGTVISLDYSFTIRASAFGGAAVSKAVTISIFVCRNEVISLIEDAALTHS